MIEEEGEHSQQKKKLLIVGAGPVGLSAALFISSNPNIQIQIIDKLTHPASDLQSRGILVNARTMALFNGYQVQKNILENSIWINNLTLSTPYFTAMQIKLNEVLSKKTKFPNMYIIPQTKTERFLEEELLELGIRVKRGVELIELRNQQGNGVYVKFSNDPVQKHYDILLGADGAKSSVRHLAGINFSGTKMETTINLVDYEIQTEEDLWRKCHYYISNPEFLLCIPLKEKTVRVIANFEQFEQSVEQIYKLKLGKKLWQSQYTLSNGHAETMSVGDVYLAGDSAHAQVPLGGRGMNMGIEDAFLFSHLLAENRVKEYNAMRLPVIEEFVNQMKSRTFVAEYQKSWKKFLAPYVVKIAGYFVKEKMAYFSNGLDHEIPFLGPEN